MSKECCMLLAAVCEVVLPRSSSHLLMHRLSLVRDSRGTALSVGIWVIAVLYIPFALLVRVTYSDHYLYAVFCLCLLDYRELRFSFMSNLSKSRG